MSQKQIWKPVPYKPFDKKYVVSDLGNVKPINKSKYSRLKGQYLMPGIGARGYGCVTLYHEGNEKQCFVHRMVAYAFLDTPPKGKNLVCHLDDNKLNNVADNLIWGDIQDNMRHMVEHRRSLVGSRNPRAKLDDVKVHTIRKLYDEGSYNQTELAVTFGVTQTMISRLVRRQTYRNML